MGRRKKAPLRETIRDQLAEKGFDPLAQLVNLLEARIPIREDQLSDPVITLLVSQDWSVEPLPAPVNGKTHCLVPRLKVRIEAARDLLGFVYPRLRSTETKVDNQHSLTVVIQRIDGSASRSIDLPPARTPAIVEPGTVVAEVPDVFPGR